MLPSVQELNATENCAPLYYGTPMGLSECCTWRRAFGDEAMVQSYSRKQLEFLIVKENPVLYLFWMGMKLPKGYLQSNDGSERSPRPNVDPETDDRIENGFDPIIVRHHSNELSRLKFLPSALSACKTTPRNGIWWYGTIPHHTIHRYRHTDDADVSSWLVYVRLLVGPPSSPFGSGGVLDPRKSEDTFTPS